jgi:hypothetical protein
MSDKSQTGGIIVPITDDLIDRREAYDPAKHKGHSLRKMLYGEILAEGGKSLATMDDSLITDGYATHVIAGFDKFLGMGGEQAALAFDTGIVAVQQTESDIILNNAQAVNFEDFQSAVSN